MIATVRLDKNLEATLNQLSNHLHKKKSDVIREALSFYAKNIEKTQKHRILSAVDKIQHADHKEYILWEETLSDGI